MAPRRGAARRRWHVLLVALICGLIGILIGFVLRPERQAEPKPLLSEPKPLRVGYVQGDLLVREGNGISHYKCDGFKVECYEVFVVVHVDSAKQPTWTGNYMLTIPWSKIEHMTLQPTVANSR